MDDNFGVLGLPERDPIRRSVMMPGEHMGTFQERCNSLDRELGPQTPYERDLVDDIARIIWELLRVRNFRDGSIVAEFRELAGGVLDDGQLGKPTYVNWIDEKDLALIDDLCSNEPARLSKAIEVFRKRGFSREHILARAAQNVQAQTAIYDKQIASLESRRRQLYNEFRKLKDHRMKVNEDAY